MENKNNLKVWNRDTSWEDYGLVQESIQYKGEPTGKKMIIRHGEFLAMVSDKYYLFPHEEAIKASDQASELVGLEKFIMDTPGVENRGHVSYSEDERQMKAFYAIQGLKKIDGDDLKVGIQIYNSLDGSRGFGAGLFTYRAICGNGVIFGKKDFVSIRHKHTAGLDRIVEGLQLTMMQIMEKALDIVAEYRMMTEQKITGELINRLKKATFVPKYALPDSLREAEAIIPDLTQWDVYNDITQAIWHNAETGLKSKELQFGDLHRVMLSPQVRRI